MDVKKLLIVSGVAFVALLVMLNVSTDFGFDNDGNFAGQGISMGGLKKSVSKGDLSDGLDIKPSSSEKRIKSDIMIADPSSLKITESFGFGTSHSDESEGDSKPDDDPIIIESIDYKNYYSEYLTLFDNDCTEYVTFDLEHLEPSTDYTYSFFGETGYFSSDERGEQTLDLEFPLISVDTDSPCLTSPVDSHRIMEFYKVDFLTYKKAGVDSVFEDNKINIIQLTSLDLRPYKYGDSRLSEIFTLFNSGSVDDGIEMIFGINAIQDGDLSFLSNEVFDDRRYNEEMNIYFSSDLITFDDNYLERCYDLSLDNVEIYFPEVYDSLREKIELSGILDLVETLSIDEIINLVDETATICFESDGTSFNFDNFDTTSPGFTINLDSTYNLDINIDSQSYGSEGLINIGYKLDIELSASDELLDFVEDAVEPFCAALGTTGAEIPFLPILIEALCEEVTTDLVDSLVGASFKHESFIDDICKAVASINVNEQVNRLEFSESFIDDKSISSYIGGGFILPYHFYIKFLDDFNYDVTSINLDSSTPVLEEDIIEGVCYTTQSFNYLNERLTSNEFKESFSINLNDFMNNQGSLAHLDLTGNYFQRSILEALRVFRFPEHPTIPNYVDNNLDWTSVQYNNNHIGYTLMDRGIIFQLENVLYNDVDASDYDYWNGYEYMSGEYLSKPHNRLSSVDLGFNSYENDIFFRTTTATLNQYLYVMGKTPLLNYEVSLDSLELASGLDISGALPEINDYDNVNVKFSMGMPAVITMSNPLLVNEESLYFNFANYYMDLIDVNNNEIIAKFAINGFAGTYDGTLTIDLIGVTDESDSLIGDNIDGHFEVSLNPSYNVVLLDHKFEQQLSFGEVYELFNGGMYTFSGGFFNEYLTPKFESLFNEFIVPEFDKDTYSELSSSFDVDPFDVVLNNFSFEGENIIHIFDLESR